MDFATFADGGLTDRLERARSELARRPAEALVAAARRTLDATEPTVPRRTGALAASGRIVGPRITGNRISVSIRFGGPGIRYVGVAYGAQNVRRPPTRLNPQTKVPYTRTPPGEAKWTSMTAFRLAGEIEQLLDDAVLGAASGE